MTLVFTPVPARGLLVEYRTRNFQGGASNLTRDHFQAIKLEQVANLLCAEANSASYLCGTIAYGLQGLPGVQQQQERPTGIRLYDRSPI